MIRNYYTLLQVAKELKSLIGWTVVNCFTQEKGQLIIEITNNKETKYISFNTDGKNDCIYLNHKFSRAKNNSMDLMHDLYDEVLQNVSIVGKNRIVKIEFNNVLAYFQLFGGDNSNLFLTNFDNKIFDSFKQSSEFFGKQYIISNEEAPEFWEFDSNTQIITALSSSSFLFGKYYSSIICHKLNINPDSQLADLDNNKINSLLEESQNIIKTLINTNDFYIYSNKNDDVILSLISNKVDKILLQTTSISEAIRFRVIKEIKSNNYDSIFKKIKSRLIFLINKQNKKINIMSDYDTINKRITSYKKFGNALMTIPEGKEKLDTPIDIEYEGEDLQININNNLTTIQNAQKFYEKAKHSEAELKNREKRLPVEQKKLDKLKELQDIINNCSDTKELEKIIEENSKMLELNDINPKNKEVAPSSKYREFDLGENYKLYVGKNAASNDELTMRFAKPNDLWMHARGTSGSHAIVRLDKEMKLPKHILTKAAEITAYYSGARNAKYVPVVYTFKKYVRKPKGANIGAVVISKEDVIMVEPKLPEGSVDN